MKALEEPFDNLIELAELKKALRGSVATYELSGCIEPVKPAIINGMSGGRTIVVARDDVRARQLHNSFQAYGDKGVFFPGKDVMFYQADIRGNALTKERINAIKEILNQKEVTVFLSVDGLINCLPAKEVFSSNSLSARVGDSVDLDKWIKTLLSLGYDNVSSVDHPGEFTVRGGILDVFPLTSDMPYRVELFGDEVDSIRKFSVESQTSVEKVDVIDIDPASEVVLTEDDIYRGIRLMEEDADKLYNKLREESKIVEASRIQKSTEQIIDEIRGGWGMQELESHLPYFVDKTYSILDYFDDALVIFDDARNLEEELIVRESEFLDSMTRRLEKGYLLPRQLEMMKTSKEIMTKLKKFHRLILSVLDTRIANITIKKNYYINATSITSYGGSFEKLVEDLSKYKKKSTRVIITSASRTKAKRLAKDLLDRDLNAYYSENKDKEVLEGEVLVTVGEIEKGYTFPDINYVLITENDIFGSKAAVKKRRRKKFKGERFNSLQELKNGDYVVHENHGVGIYRGIEKIEVEGVMKDYIKIEYAKGGNLFILASSFDMIQKYGGADSKKPKLNTLGTAAWSRTKQSVENAVGEVAKELVELYALRQQDKGYVYSKDTLWQTEFEETFPYEETKGQQEAIEAMKADMESPKIMDRLICGDVGYGKTEIAIRGAFKAVQDNKQVVMLCPTTILAQQHYNTFIQRMENYPVNIELLCRFRTPSQQKQTIEGLKSGKVDIVIGTHRVLSKDVSFSDLGLLIIDEEQRFGVAHKEKIKTLKKNIDVISLTATPIPRTLHMSLAGIRDMSVLEEAPVDRMPIQTFVFEYNEEMVRDAILREMHRGGQVYYVYNRINTIMEMTNKIKELVPEANVEYAHGRMSESRLEEIMSDFVNGEIDVLISTTIIEIGLDIPNVNTMIIHDAERLGLSQLYQLRGRIGRSNRMAYAFFMYKKDKILKEEAEKRLAAIKEFSDLGSGFKIALRDLEMRGAGNILGKSQHGHMEAVGYDLYCKMLNNALKLEKGDKDIPAHSTEIDINIDAYIPPKYISDEVHKLDIYKRISEIKNDDEYDAMLEELLDRFGEIPKPVMNLMNIARLKYNALRSCVTKISRSDNEIRIRMYNKARFNPEGIIDLVERRHPVITFSANPKNPEFTYNIKADNVKSPEEMCDTLLDFLQDLQKIREE